MIDPKIIFGMVTPFTIDLNNPSDFTKENIKKLIASHNDSINTQFRITREGILYLSKYVGHDRLDGVQYYMETNCEGNNYTGIDASEDEGWVDQVFYTIERAWTKSNHPERPRLIGTP